MRVSGVLHPTEQVYAPPDTAFTFLMTGGSSAQASDWLSSGSTAAANAAAAGVGLVRITPITTSSVPLYVTANLYSTFAAANLGTSSLSSGSVYASTNIGSPIPAQGMMFQVTGSSTGFSVASQTSGYVHVEMWKK